MLKAEWSSKAGQAMKPKVYVETTILSYLAARPSRQPVTAGRQVITRQWWETERKKYNLVVSEVVEAECERGDAESASRRRKLLGDVAFPLEGEDTGIGAAARGSGCDPGEGRPRCSAYRGSGSEGV